MDLTNIRIFDTYIPCYDEDPRQLLEDILYKADYLTPADLTLIRTTYIYALEKHAGQTRHSDEPYIVHPVRVLGFLMEMHPDIPSMQAALLHDVIEDCDVTYSDIERKFGKEVANLCEGLVKVSKVRYTWEVRQLETLKKTFLAMGKDLRVIIIKLADRVHNVQTLKYHPKIEKAERIATETLQVFVPIAKRLGIYNFQWYLENGAFKILEPKEYDRILQFVETIYTGESIQKELKKQAIQTLCDVCESSWIQTLSIKGRLKSPYRIFVKLQKYHTSDLGKVFDILAFRIVVPTIADCYTTLWLIHGTRTPIFSKLKDYIALPKPNGYKSLHTTILGMFDFPVEIQIRTAEMNEVAEYGVAAHFAYAEANKSVKISESQSQRIHQLQEIVESYAEGTDQEGFKESLELEVFQKDIFVYTPKGDIIQMPVGSTVLDFAFRVHSEVGLRFKSGFINGKIVPIDYALKTGDIVAVQTFKNKYTATRWWLPVLHTPSAKTKLHKYLRHIEHIEREHAVVEILNQKLSEYKLPYIDHKDDKIRKLYKWGDFEEMVNKIYDKHISPLKLIKEVYADKFIELNEAEKQTIRENQQKNAVKKELKESPTRIYIDGDHKFDVNLCPECCPDESKKIIAKSDKNGIKIHCLGCRALQTVHYNKLYEAHWHGCIETVYYLHILLESDEKKWLLMQLLKIFDFYNITVQSLQTVWEQYEICLEFPNPSKMSYILDELKHKTQLRVIKKEIL
jgi:GTP diphosphokinase / guanosine-3',5'-bis(diphosphate) 3'-diphosphatase